MLHFKEESVGIFIEPIMLSSLTTSIGILFAPLFLVQDLRKVLFVYYSVTGMTGTSDPVDNQGILNGTFSSSPNTQKASPNVEKKYSQELLEIYNKLNSIEDSDVLQKIVDIVEDTGTFEITPSTFDFDLCRLDSNTINTIKTCLQIS